MRRALAAALAALLPLSSSPAFADTPPLKIEKIIRPSAAGAAPIEVVAERLLIRFDLSADAAKRAAALAAVSGTVVTNLLGWTIVSLPAGTSVTPALNAVKNFPGVAEAAYDRVYRPVAVPNDPLTTQQYALQQANAFAAWEYEKGTSNTVTVVVIDSGIEGVHPDLASKVAWTGASAVKHQSVDNTTGALTPEATPTAACVHGTQVGSIAAAATNNGLGVAGMSWGAQLLSLKVFNAGCGGATSDCACGTTDTATAAALDYVRTTVAAAANAATVGKVVVNMSLGGPGPCGAASLSALTKTALTNLMASANPVPVIIASGNAPNCSSPAVDGTGVDSPANCAGQVGGLGIIPVGATDSSSRVASFSCTGPELAAHGLVAPGTNVLVDTPGGGAAATTSNSGTSFAAPYAAGAAALMLSAKPTLTPAQVESYLRGGARSLGPSSLQAASLEPAGNSTGAGTLDAFRSTRLAIKGTLADFDGETKAIAFPNPFRMSQNQTVAFAIPTSVQGTNPLIKIYTADGILVRTLSGLSWDGKNDSGTLVGSGTYIFLVTTDAGKTKGRVAVIR